MSALGGFLSGFDQAGGQQALGQGLQDAIHPAATPGVSQAQNDQVDAQLQGANAASDAANPELQAALHPMADPNHPVWNVLGAAAGGGGGGIPTGVDGMQSGGLVRRNSGSPTRAIPQMNGKPALGEVRPAVDANAVDDAPTLAMRKGGVVPEMAAGRGRSMGQGITPGSTEGQIVTMESGGPVPGYDQGGAVSDMGMPPSGSNFMSVPGQATPPVTGRAAGLSTGLAAGMAEGHNLREAFEQRQQREAAVGATNASEDVWEKQYRKANGMPDAEDEQQGGLRATINNFMHHLIHHSHDSDGSTPNQQLVGQAGVTYPQQGGGAISAPAGATPAAPAQGAGIPPAAPQPGAPAQPGAAPAPASTPASPATQAAAKGTQIAAAATGNPAQAQATGAAAAKAVTESSAAAAAGTTPEQQAPPKASLDPRDVIAMERAKIRAANAATRAGMDGGRVYNALSMQQNAHFQGQYLQQIALAQQALTRGNYDDMQKYLRNANYYLPNGQDLEFKKASDVFSADDLQKRGLDSNTRVINNPFYGLPGHTSDPQYVPLNPMTLGALGQNALDPRAFTSGFQEQYKLGVEAQANLTKANAAQTLGTGRLLQGQAAVTNAHTTMFLAPYRASMDQAHADAYEASANKALKGNAGGGMKVTPSSVLASQKAAGSAFDNAAQGELEPVPTQTPQLGADGKPVLGPDGKPVMQDNLSPGAGRQVRNPNNVSPLFKDLTAGERQNGRQMAQTLAGANVGRMSPEEAGQLSAMIIRDQREASRNGGRGGTHINPDTGKPERNVVYAPDKGADGQQYPAVWVWNNGRYVHAWTTPNMSEDTGSAQTGIPSGGTGGSASAGESTDNDSADEGVMEGR